MGLHLLFAFQEPWFHLSELQPPLSYLQTLQSSVAILVFSLVPAALPELLSCMLQGLWLPVLSNLAPNVWDHCLLPEWAVLKGVPVCQQFRKMD